ncbi:NAD-dependent DNA ligase LigB, partial [Pseudomonas amygdali pv. mori str. 301020]
MRKVSFNIGRSGRITPVLELTPVRLDDRTVSRISTGSLQRWQSPTRWTVTPSADRQHYSK